MPTDAQKTDILFKKSVGKVATDTTKKFFEEVNKTYNIIYSNAIWAESDLIPPVAPVLVDGASIGVVQYFEERIMSSVPGTSNSFFLAELQDAIPFDFDNNGSYVYRILNNLNQPIVFGQNDWVLDQGGGTLTFFDSVPGNMPPKISFYKYIGLKGVGSGGGSALTVKEFDNDPIGLNIDEILFNGSDETVVIIGNQAYINAPSPPQNLNGNLILAGTTLYTGRESQSNINYEGSAGDSHDYIITDTTFTLSVNSFSNASLGNLILNINGIDIANVDLAVNFNELNRNTNQDISTYDTIGSGSPITNGVVNFTGGNLTINNIHWTNPIGVDPYQDGSFTVNIILDTALRQGYNTFTVRHEHSALIYSTNTLQLFYDTDIGTDPTITATNLNLNTLVGKWISGIQYCFTGTTFDLDFNGNDCFDNVYHVSNAPVSISSVWINNEDMLYTDTSVTTVSTPPDISEVFTCTNKLVTVLTDNEIDDAIIDITPRDPYASYTTVSTPSNNIMIMSIINNSDKTTEHFCDEIYRFPNTTDFNVVPAGITGNFNSNTNLLNASRTSELQVYDIFSTTTRSLIWPYSNYALRVPIGGANYTSLNAGTNFEYNRVFQADIDKSNGTVTINGINDADLGLLVFVYLKVPSKTDWMRLDLDYNLTTFNENVKFVNTPWALNNLTSVDDWIVPTVSNGFKYRCSSSGTTSGVEPIWNTTVGNTTNDNTVIWTCYQIDNGEGCRINPTINSPNINNSVEFTVGGYAVDLAVNRCMFIKVVYDNPGITNIIEDELSIDW